MRRIVLSTVLARTGARMWTVALVLFALDVYHSAPIAGAVAFAAVAPSLLVSPIAGALLDRYGRSSLVALDYAVGAAGAGTIVALFVLGHLGPGLFIGVVALATITTSLSAAGVRSLFPAILPPHLWDAANGLDSATQETAGIAGPALAGLLSGVLHPALAIGVVGLFWIAGAAVLFGTDLQTQQRPATQSIWADAWAGMRYVLRNPTLRGLGITVSMINFSSGVLIVALPVLVETTLHGSALDVGLLFSMAGIASVSSALVTGRLGSEDRERNFLAVGGVICGVAIGLLALPIGYWAPIAAMLLYGLCGGPLDIGLFALRQRRTDPAWYGRAFSFSMALNYTGTPIGSAVAGIAIVGAFNPTVVGAAIVAVASAAVLYLAVPRHG
jgi:MFS family permease